MRKLVAALAVRVQGSRLYGKPLQHLDVDDKVTILDHIIAVIRTIPAIQEIALGVSEGVENRVFLDVAKRHGIGAITGDERDVLSRLIACGRQGRATDVFRVTTESPFCYYELVEEAWRRHVAARHDVTAIDGVPEGGYFEIYTMEALERSHRLGDARHRSELCSLYVREHLDDFAVEVLPIPPEVDRLDLRLTVDYPEDLVLCRRVYAQLKRYAPRIPMAEIVAFLDSRPELRALVAPYVVEKRLWPLPESCRSSASQGAR